MILYFLTESDHHKLCSIKRGFLIHISNFVSPENFRTLKSIDPISNLI